MTLPITLDAEVLLARLGSRPPFNTPEAEALLDELRHFLSNPGQKNTGPQNVELVCTAISCVLDAYVTPPIVLLDVDGVVNLIEADLPIRPGLQLLARIITLLGAQLILWSGAGAAHAQDEATRAQITDYVTTYLDKPDYPMVAAAAYALLPYAPVLQVDDDATEHIATWPFLHLPMQPFLNSGQYFHYGLTERSYRAWRP